MGDVLLRNFQGLQPTLKGKMVFNYSAMKATMNRKPCTWCFHRVASKVEYTTAQQKVELPYS